MIFSCGFVFLQTLGIKTFLKSETIPINFISLACPWTGTMLANKEQGYDENAGSETDKLISGLLPIFANVYYAVTNENPEDKLLELASNKSYSHITDKKGLYELGSRNCSLNSHNELSLLQKKGCQIYFFVAIGDPVINIKSSTCSGFNNNIIKVRAEGQSMYSHRNIVNNSFVIKKIKSIIEG
ncbi:MAG: hypothetical protein GY830_04590 [Bacteroidetes bacterium]|nr:hypothetical protein [Bacteroidota bacterium]